MAWTSRISTPKEASECKTQTQQQTDMNTNRTKTDANRTKTDTNRTTQRRTKRENKVKTQAKHKNSHKKHSTESRSKALERGEMDWTGLDWEDGDDNVLRETNPRTSKRLQAHDPLHSRRACEAK